MGNSVKNEEKNRKIRKDRLLIVVRFIIIISAVAVKLKSVSVTHIHKINIFLVPFLGLVHSEQKHAQI